MQTVEIIQAFAFICEACGNHSFGLMQPVPECELPGLLAELNADAIDEGFAGAALVSVPQVVTCQHCNAQYKSAFQNE